MPSGPGGSRPPCRQPARPVGLNASQDAEPLGLYLGDGHSSRLQRTRAPCEYVSHDFSNRSQDILGIFTAACDRVGVGYRRDPERIRICRRKSVALRQEHVGVKG